MHIRQDEKEIVGGWIVQDGRATGDEMWRRILWLADEILTKVADSPTYGAWETLFQDPADGRYWERTYPHSEAHGGGPPVLRNISADEARAKYRL